MPLKVFKHRLHQLSDVDGLPFQIYQFDELFLFLDGAHGSPVFGLPRTNFMLVSEDVNRWQEDGEQRDKSLGDFVALLRQAHNHINGVDANIVIQSLQIILERVNDATKVLHELFRLGPLDDFLCASQPQKSAWLNLFPYAHDEHGKELL